MKQNTVGVEDKIITRIFSKFLQVKKHANLFDDQSCVFIHRLKKSGKWAIGKQFKYPDEATKGERIYFYPAKSADNYSEVYLLKNLGQSRGVSVSSEVKSFIETLELGDEVSPDNNLERIK